MEKFREIGIDVRLHTPVAEVEKDGQRVVHARSDREEQFAADLVVHAYPTGASDITHML
jgi:L-2-hydroxyglutarate oxidase LhgO